MNIVGCEVLLAGMREGVPSDLIVSLEGPEMLYSNPGCESGHLYSSDESLATYGLPGLILFSSMKWEWGNK